MAKNNQAIIRLSKKLLAVTLITELGYNDKEVAEYIRALLPDIRLGTANFSKLKNAYKKNIYRLGVSEKTYLKIFKLLDPDLESKGFTYDSAKFQYVKTTNGGAITSDSTKLDGLRGKWMGFSWNRMKTEDSVNLPIRESYFNIFKFEVIDFKTVKCQTKNENFDKGNMLLVSDDRITIELSTSNRVVYLTGAISKSNNLNNKKYLSLVYADTGNDHVGCGLAVLRRVTDDYFDKITVGSRAMSHFANTEDKSIIKALDKTQYPPIKTDDLN